MRILVGILVEDYGREEKSKIKISTENTLEYLASVDELKMDRIVDARNLNKNHDENLKIRLWFDDYFQDSSLDFEPKAIPIKPLLQSNVLLRILVRILF